MQPTCPPRKMMLLMRLLCVLSKGSPPQFVNVQKIIVLNVFTHTIVGTKLYMKHNGYHIWCAISVCRFGVVPCSAWMILGLEGWQFFGVLWGFSRRREAWD